MKDKILGTFIWPSYWNALGMPSELWNRNKIKRFFGKITTF